jgi:hypothetical protein
VVAGSDSQRETTWLPSVPFGDSEYLGEIFTLSLRAKNVRIVSVSRTNENAPSHPVYAEARVVELDREVVAALVRARRPTPTSSMTKAPRPAASSGPVPIAARATDERQRHRPPGAIRAGFSCTAQCARTKST